MKKKLDEIVLSKKKEIEFRKKVARQEIFESSPFFSRSPFSLSRALSENNTGIIAEYKRKSPSKGLINDKVAASEVASVYASCGAAAISVLTDTPYFGGSLDDLLAVRDMVSIPVLRKDFIIDEYQIYEARAFGADAILLIAAILDNEQVKHLSYVARSLELEILFEIHSREEARKLIPGQHIAGINNRNLQTFEVDIENSINLASEISSEFLKVAESGIQSSSELLFLKNQGFDGFLISERFMKYENPGKAFSEFVAEISK